jgi:hypothetical protein
MTLLVAGSAIQPNCLGIIARMHQAKPAIHLEALLIEVNHQQAATCHRRLPKAGARSPMRPPASQCEIVIGIVDGMIAHDAVQGVSPQHTPHEFVGQPFAPINRQ